jgi:hypothetical protein
MKAAVVDLVVAEGSPMGSVNAITLLSAANTRSRVEWSRVHRHVGPRRSLSSSGRVVAIAAAGHPHPPESLGRRKEAKMGRIIVANRHGHQVVEWNNTGTDTEEARATIAQAEQILREARAAGCAISKKVDGVHVLDRGEFDPAAEEYQVIAPIAGG